jgi:hypothetical protein
MFVVIKHPHVGEHTRMHAHAYTRTRMHAHACTHTHKYASQRASVVSYYYVICSPILFALIMEELCSSETSVLRRATRHNIQQDTILHFLITLIISTFFFWQFFFCSFDKECKLSTLFKEEYWFGILIEEEFGMNTEISILKAIEMELQQMKWFQYPFKGWRLWLFIDVRYGVKIAVAMKRCIDLRPSPIPTSGIVQPFYIHPLQSYCLPSSPPLLPFSHFFVIKVSYIFRQTSPTFAMFFRCTGVAPCLILSLSSSSSLILFDYIP